MAQRTWTAVDAYFDGLLVGEDEALTAATAASEAAGLPAHQVAPNQGKLLHLLARIRGARNILEIGTLGGYSTIWLARALPGGAGAWSRWRRTSGVPTPPPPTSPAPGWRTGSRSAAAGPSTSCPG